MVHEPGPMIPGRQAPPPKSKRFYERATAEERDGAHALMLDGRAAKTPAKRPLALPSAAAAQVLAEEWDAQVAVIDPARMPFTRLCNTAIDGVAAQMAAVADEVKTYLASDLLAYRAADPEPLVAAQAKAWDPVLDWARDSFGARLVLAEGITFVKQPPATLSALGTVVDAIVGQGAGAPFRLAALNVMTTLTGSALLALAVMHGRLAPEAAWAAAHVDELFQESRWGSDVEALERRERRWADMRAAATLGLLAEKSIAKASFQAALPVLHRPGGSEDTKKAPDGRAAGSLFDVDGGSRRTSLDAHSRSPAAE